MFRVFITVRLDCTVMKQSFKSVVLYGQARAESSWRQPSRQCILRPAAMRSECIAPRPHSSV